MSYQLIRTSYEATGIYGKLLDSNGNYVCNTVEYAFPNGDTYQSKLPVGSYRCTLSPVRLSFGDPYQTYTLINVPNSNGFTFQAGTSQIAGIIGLGEERVGNQLINPQKAFDCFIDNLIPAPVFHLTVS